MNYWIFVASDAAVPDHNAEDAYRIRMGHRLWGAGPHRKDLRTGDKVVFYLASPTMAFAGTATISSTDLSATELDRLRTERVSLAEDGVRLAEIDVWPEPKPIKPLLEDLAFITNTKNWGGHLRHWARKIPEEDFELITLN